MNLSMQSDVVACPTNTIYRVYRKGKLVAQGTPEELQMFFNERARSLRFKLRDWAALPDDIQHKNKYQIETQAEYQREIDECLQHIECLAAEHREPFVWPDDLDEYELLFNPNSLPLKAKIRRKRSRYHRYYRQQYVDTWKQTQKEIATDLAPVIAEVNQQLPAMEFRAERKQREFLKIAPRSDKWSHKLTEVERNHLEQKKADRMKRRAAMQAQFYK